MGYFINISITASVTALLIIAIKTLLKNKISPKWQFFIWIILAVRLSIPVLPESNISIFNVFPQVKNTENSYKINVNIASEIKTTAVENLAFQGMDNKFVSGSTLESNLFMIWGLGAALMLLFMMMSYYLFHKKISNFKVVDEPDVLNTLNECKRAAGVNKKVIIKSGGEIPMLKGILRPEILLPAGYTGKELSSVFTHELMHLKYKDVLWNIISTLLLCIYWYNPLMWYCFFVFRRDMEILCDYRVLKVYDNRKEYASILLKTAVKKNGFILGTTSMKNSEKDITIRIKNIAFFKKPKTIWTITAITAAIVVTVLCLTNSKGNSGNAVNGLNSQKTYKNAGTASSDTKSIVEKNLEIIMSSPKTSSNPNDYIKAHQAEYESIIKMGDEALNYMLSLFKNGETKDLKAHIMMSLCIDILGNRNNVKEGSYSSPEEWYAKLSLINSKLPLFKYETNDNIERLVYAAALEKYSKNEDSVTIIAPHIFGTYESGNELKIFTTVYYSEYKLNDKIFSEEGGGVVPAAIIYVKNSDKTYSFKEYIEAMDGSYFQKSIEEFCKPRADIAKAIMEHYSNYSDLRELMKSNIVIYLKANGFKDIKLKQSDGKIVPLT